MRILIERDDLAHAAAEGARLASPDLEVERVDIRPAHRGFRKFVNDAAFDVSELAIATLLQAVAYDRPIVFLPITTLSRDQHRTLVTRQDRTVSEIAGATVGVRSWSQTTGVWLRGLLSSEYGVALHEVKWVVYDPGHVPEHDDPDWVRRAPAGSALVIELQAGTLDYAIFGNDVPVDPEVHAAIPDADLAARRFAEREGFVPVNHVLATTAAVARRDSETLCAMCDAMAAVLAVTDAGGGRTEPVGFEALRAPVERVAEFALEQEVIPRRVEFDEIVARSCDALGVPASRFQYPGSVPDQGATPIHVDGERRG